MARGQISTGTTFYKPIKKHKPTFQVKGTNPVSFFIAKLAVTCYEGKRFVLCVRCQWLVQVTEESLQHPRYLLGGSDAKDVRYISACYEQTARLICAAC